jgi:hypothetical protein
MKAEEAEEADNHNDEKLQGRHMNLDVCNGRLKAALFIVGQNLEYALEVIFY